MMFYGASNPKIAVKEVGRKEDYPLLSGNFIRIKESGYLICLRFKAGKDQVHSAWLKRILRKEKAICFCGTIDRITHPVDDRKEAEEVYRPIQVLQSICREWEICMESYIEAVWLIRCRDILIM